MTHLKNASNLLFFVPLIVATHAHLYPYAVIIFLSLFTSFLYHRSREKKFVLLDSLFAYLLISINTLYCILGKFSRPAFYAVVISVLLALYFNFREKGSNKYRRYDFDHALWHATSALITLFCIFTYLAGK